MVDWESVFLISNHYITQCLLSQLLVQILTPLIQYQLNDLTLTFHKDNYHIFNYREENLSFDSIRGN